MLTFGVSNRYPESPMNQVLERLDLLERRVTALEAGAPLAPTEWLPAARNLLRARPSDPTPVPAVPPAPPAHAPVLPGDMRLPAVPAETARVRSASIPLLPSAPPLHRHAVVETR